MSIPESVVASVVSAMITGPAGYLLKRITTRNDYLPRIEVSDSPTAYQSLSGEWFFYYCTHDPQQVAAPVLATGRITLLLRKHLIVEGRDKVIGLTHRPELSYKLRGEVRAGQLYWTAVCEQDPSDAYSCMFTNLLGDEVAGIMIARDYARQQYASPALLTRARHPDEEAKRLLADSKIALYRP